LRWKLLDSETYRVNSMVKSLIADGLGPRHPEPTGKQVRLCAVVERVHVKSPQLRPLSTRMGSISLLRKDIEQPARVERCIKNLGARRRACAEVTFDRMTLSTAIGSRCLKPDHTHETQQAVNGPGAGR
jgi:hypothetical protein